MHPLHIQLLVSDPNRADVAALRAALRAAGHVVLDGEVDQVPDVVGPGPDFVITEGAAMPTPESQAEAARPVLDVVASIVGPAQALSAARVLTAFAHGFTSMETAGAFRFGGDVDEAYRFGISVLLAGLEGEGATSARS